MNEKLKPCPFCGETEEHGVGIACMYNPNDGTYDYQAQCLNCGVTLLECKTYEDAINAWNTRAYEQEQPELKPCPFCGKIPQLIDAGTYYFVACCNELCKISPCTHEHPTPENAINEWNSRPEKIIMNGELKSCPMCGSAAELIIFSNGSYSVDCSNSYECLAIMKENYNTKQEAIDAWNTRAEVNS